MRDFFEGQPVMDFFTENFKEVIEHLYQYYLSMKIDSSAVRKIYFAISDSSPDFSRKVLTVFSWLSVHFDSKTDSSKLFQKIDSSFEGNAIRILENAPSSLPSVQISGKVLSFLEACFDLILSPSLSMIIQIMGGKITENLEFKSPLWKINFF